MLFRSCSSGTFRFRSDDEWYFLSKLSVDECEYFRSQAALARLKNKSVAFELAGCISQSLQMEDPLGLSMSAIFGPFLANADASATFRQYLDTAIRSNPTRNPDDVIDSEFSVSLWKLWVNYQSQYEYNPLHNHSGFLSFVIWLTIPYSHNEQAKLPFVRDSNASGSVGNFVFTGRGFHKECIVMQPSMECCFCLFPSSYRHQVFPFYATDNQRVSISGNFGLQEVAMQPSLRDSEDRKSVV